MLDRLSPLAHLFGMLVEAALHGVEHMLMLPSGDASLFGGGAAMLDRAALAGIGPVAAQDQSVLRICVAVRQPFPSRTDVDVFSGQIAEVLLAKAPLRLCVRGHRLGQRNRDACIVAG